jgi:hypothetical protein
LEEQSDPGFRLEWHLSLELGLATHVTLYDGTKGTPFIAAVGHGADEAEALFELWTALVDDDADPAAIAHVAAAYAKRTGRPPAPE